GGAGRERTRRARYSRGRRGSGGAMRDLLARRPGLLVLIDPSRTSALDACRVAREAEAAGAAGIMIGSSFDGTRDTHLVAAALREATKTLPVALFPGSALQLTDQVDLVLFLSLVSGRNPQYLIEEHVRAVPFLQQHPVATLSTAYILIDGGRVTSVESVSQTRPLPADKPELAAAHATAALLIGMQAAYFEPGSGAGRPVPVHIIRACRAAVPPGPRYAVVCRQRRQCRRRAARLHRVCRPLSDHPSRDARDRAHHRYVPPDRVRQRHGIRRSIRAPGGGAGGAGRFARAAFDERREPERDPRGAVGESAGGGRRGAARENRRTPQGARRRCAGRAGRRHGPHPGAAPRDRACDLRPGGGSAA